MKFVPNLVGILSIPVYYIGLSFLFGGLFLAFARLSAFLGVEPWFLGGVGLWFILPVTVTLSLWFGHLTTRFLHSTRSREANASEGQG